MDGREGRTESGRDMKEVPEEEGGNMGRRKSRGRRREGRKERRMGNAR